MKKTKITKTLLFVLTMLLLSVFSVQQQFHILPFKPLNGVFEATAKPKLSFDAYRTAAYQTQTENHIRENFGFREPLIRLYNQFLYDFFRTSYNEEVVVGKDHWFYYIQHVNEYYGTEMYRWHNSTDEARVAFDHEAQRMWKLRGILKEYGIEFLMFMAPDKGFLYPEHLPYRKHDTTTINAREYYSAKFDEYGFPYIEMTKWFLQLKESDTLPYSLMPQAGAHWGFSAVLAADSLFRFMGELNGQRFPKMIIGPLHESSRKIKSGDRDLENTLNLMRITPHRYDKLLDAEVTIDRDSATIWPSVLFVGNSFLWRMHDFIPFDDMFSSSEYWFYNSTANFGKNYSQTASVARLDILQKIMDNDYVVWFTDGNQMYKTSYGFAESALISLCVDDSQLSNVRGHLLDSLRNDSLTLLKTQNMDGDEREGYLWTTVIQLINKDLEHYFPVLSGDSIPTARNPRVKEALTIREIKRDPEWMTALRYQSTIQNLPLDNILKTEAQNVLNNKPLMRETSDSISREVYIEMLVRDMMEELRNKPEMVESIKEKAQKSGKAFEVQLQDDARWIINQRIQKGEILQ